MDYRFLPHNSHWQQVASFALRDPNMLKLSRIPLVHHATLLQQLPTAMPGIYSLTGGRQIGKTTMLKLWMQQLLNDGVQAKSIVYITGELIDDHHALVVTMQEIQQEMPHDRLSFFIIDEVTYIRDWDKAIKFLADSGQLENTILLLTGSDSLLIQQARARFPGRRGNADQVDFHFYPLSFRETVALKYQTDTIATAMANDGHRFLSQALMEYLQHGGYLTAINDMAEHQSIQPATLRTYADWIRGDMLKHGKQEHYLREIFLGIIKRYSSQLSWNNLARDLSIDHPKTVADYIDLLTSLDAVFVQYALNTTLLNAAPKKARKVMFTDPFILHAVRAWLTHEVSPYTAQIQPLCADPEWRGKLVESVVVNHFARKYSTYYIKHAKGEVDIATVQQQRIHALEVKWTTQLRLQELKVVRTMPQARVWANVANKRDLDGLAIEPLPLGLFEM